jgi:hypothetical protein
MAAFVVPVVLWRPMDGDEGYYAIASHLVAQGKAPYADFWFQQAPLLLYVYGSVDRVVGSSWFVLRGTSALLTVLLGAAIAAHGLHRWRSPSLSFLAVALFITTPLAFDWYPTVKTYALSTLLIFGAYVAADAATRRSWTFAGVLLGLALDTRLLFTLLIVVFALYAGQHVLAFAVGLLAGLVPLLLFFVSGPARFVNDVVLSQTMRSHVSLAENVTQKIDTARGLLAEPHFLVLTLATVGLLVGSLYTEHRVPLVVAIALTLGLTNVVPTPTYDQYFVTLIPFLVVAAIDLVALVTRSHLASPAVACTALVSITLGALVSIGAPSLSRVAALRMPGSTNGVMSRIALDVSATREVSSSIDAHARSGEAVMAMWPGFLYESHAQPVPGMESNFEDQALRDTHLSPQRAHEYHMLSAQGIVEAIKSHRTRLIVVGEGQARYRTIILHAGYRPVDRLQFATLYEYAPSPLSG